MWQDGLLLEKGSWIRMATTHFIPTLPAGTFFGSACRTVETPSFHFAELEATVPDRQVSRHTHESAHFILVLSGVYSTEATNQDGPCSSATLIFNPAGTTHRDCLRSPNGRFLSITPGWKESKTLERSSLAARVIAGGSVNSTEATLITRPIEREFLGKEPPSTMVLEGLGLELIGQVARIWERIGSRHIPQWLRRTREMIEDSISSEITIAELASMAAVHPVYLARAFRKYFGTSPGEYLRRRRLLRAQRLLADTRLPLAEIALMCGFSDQSRMTHAFTNAFALPPGRYRQRSQQ
jgi:AraC family transcriptional regulator